MGAPMDIVLNTYASFLEAGMPTDLASETSAFLLALDVNGHGLLATWVSEMVSLATETRGEGYGREVLSHYLTRTFPGMGQC